MTLQATANPSCSRSDLHVGMPPLSSFSCAVTQALKSTHAHTFFFSPQPASAPCWHWLTIYLFLALGPCLAELCHWGCAAVKLMQEWIEDWTQLNCLTGFHQLFLSVERRCMLWDQLPTRGTLAAAAVPLFHLRIYGKRNLTVDYDEY